MTGVRTASPGRPTHTVVYQGGRDQDRLTWLVLFFLLVAYWTSDRIPFYGSLLRALPFQCCFRYVRSQDVLVFSCKNLPSTSLLFYFFTSVFVNKVISFSLFFSGFLPRVSMGIIWETVTRLDVLRVKECPLAPLPFPSRLFLAGLRGPPVTRSRCCGSSPERSPQRNSNRGFSRVLVFE